MGVREFQIALKARGFEPGPPDGLWGWRTEAAAMAAIATAPLPLPTDQPRATRPIKEIILHCTATPEGREIGIETIRGWHVKGNGWVDIGYHHVVHLDGTVEAGRSEALVGAHVTGRNTGTLGIVYVGGTAADGMPKDTRTPEQRDALTALVLALLAKYPTIRKVSGHNQYAAKACPSFSVPDDPLGKLI